MESWRIRPLTVPTIIRKCSRCGNGSRFICSGDFRVNANGKRIDAWLIYKCRKCDATWNMEVIQRVPSHSIDGRLLQAFAHNDWDTAIERLA